MRYRRILLLTELESDSRGALAHLRRVAPEAELLVVFARMPQRQVAWFTDAAPAELQAAATASLESMRTAAAGAAARVEVQLAPSLTTEALAAFAGDNAIDLIAAGPLSPSGFALVAELRRRCRLPLLLPAGGAAPDQPIRRIFCRAPRESTLRALGRFLRDHGEPALHAVVALSEVPAAERAGAMLDVAGITSSVELTRTSNARDLASGPRGTRGTFDLLVLPRFPGALALAAAGWRAPVLVLPPAASSWPAGRAIDAPDVVNDAGVMGLTVEYALGVGRRDPIADQQIALVAGGRTVAVVETSAGRAELPSDLNASSLGLYRMAERGELDPIAAVETEVSVIRPGSRPLVLYPAELPDSDLTLLAAFTRDASAATAPELLALRMRTTRSCRELRARLAAAGLATRLADASTVLDEGEALDVAETLYAVRLARVAARMRAAGFPVVGVVHSGPRPPHAGGVAVLRASELAGMRWEAASSTPAASPSMDARLQATTGAPLLAGNLVAIEMDNAQARGWLLDAINGSKEHVHVQLYMAADDDVGSQVEAALADAGARGARVRVLVDSLHGLHGSLGLHNPLLERLAAHPGVEVLVSRAIEGVPSLEDVKQRDHRKLAIVDGAVALVGGRNLSHEYYTGFHEVRLTPESPWRDVPWLDAGARVQGPAVTALERHFLEAWTEAGGSAFEVREQPPAGTTPARVVVHRGLRDAATLEAYLAMIDGAESHVYAVNGFPLILEIQHALLRAIRRGVQVRVLFGHLTPRHVGGPFNGPWARARTAATEYVHSRVDALVAAGGEGFQLVVPEQPGWAAGIGPINPHVHAKVVSADGRVCAVGSANLDITAGYWESELMLLVEDATIAGVLEARIENLLAVSERVDRNDPRWQRLARRRDWMRHWPGVLSI